jgi:hypothetical protein
MIGSGRAGKGAVASSSIRCSKFHTAKARQLQVVIASAAKQSIAKARMDCFVAPLLAMTLPGHRHTSAISPHDPREFFQKHRTI